VEEGSEDGRPGRATIKDVAALAGVSTTTVSHTLSGKGRVDPATRERVRAAVDQLGYRASRAASALRTRRTRTLAFLVPALERASFEARLVSIDVYMNQAAAAAKAAFAAEHAMLMIPPTATAPDLAELGVDGGIVCDPLNQDPLVGLFESLDLPVVTVERDLGRPEHDWYVSADNHRSTTELLDHLAGQGAERIALLSVDLPIAWGAEVIEAYEAWCGIHGMAPRTAPVDPHHQENGAYAVAASMLDEQLPPDAIVASDERFPHAVLRAAGERGIRIPRELMVATCIDSHAAREATPAITAVDIDPGLQGATAAELLIGRLSHSDPERPLVTPASLRVRASTLRTEAAR
jgi:DNA-binding LacI/PurR family transcriptional regulator